MPRRITYQGRTAALRQYSPSRLAVNHEEDFDFADVARRQKIENVMSIAHDGLTAVQHDRSVLAMDEYSRLDQKLDNLVDQVKTVLELAQTNHAEPIRNMSDFDLVEHARRCQERLLARGLSITGVVPVNAVMDEHAHKQAVDSINAVMAELCLKKAVIESAAPLSRPVTVSSSTAKSSIPALVRIPSTGAEQVAVEPHVSRKGPTSSDVAARIRAHLDKPTEIMPALATSSASINGWGLAVPQAPVEKIVKSPVSSNNDTSARVSSGWGIPAQPVSAPHVSAVASTPTPVDTTTKPPATAVVATEPIAIPPEQVMTGPRVDSPVRVPWVMEAQDLYGLPSIAREPVLDLVQVLRDAKVDTAEEVCDAVNEWRDYLHQWLLREQQIVREEEEEDEEDEEEHDSPQYSAEVNNRRIRRACY